MSGLPSSGETGVSRDRSKVTREILGLLKDGESVPECTSPDNIGGTVIRKKIQEPKHETKPSGYSVYVGRVPLNMSQSMFCQLFRRCGTVLKVRLIIPNEDMSYKYGFVTYSNIKSAKMAVTIMHNYEIHGNKLKVELTFDSQSDDDTKYKYSYTEKQILSKLKQNLSKMKTGSNKPLHDTLQAMIGKLRTMKCELVDSIGSEGMILDIPQYQDKLT
ncbi:putative RNA-binding protein 46 [Saccoglossus kowalevskii]